MTDKQLQEFKEARERAQNVERKQAPTSLVHGRVPTWGGYK